MGKYKEVYGNLITLANSGEFDVIAHGCNIWCVMGSGIAPKMAKAFGADRFKMESREYRGDINKLGTIDYEHKTLLIKGEEDFYDFNLAVVNCYTQFNVAKYPGERVIDYCALSLCLKKINHYFGGTRVGLPLIGGGLAGGDPDEIREIIKRELYSCDTTLVLFDPNLPECQ